MARTTERLLSTNPSALAPARISISHPFERLSPCLNLNLTSIPSRQLRDLITCPQERGMVNYVKDKSISEHDVADPQSIPRRICRLDFTPNALSSYALPDSESYLLAAGGQDCELHLSMHTRVYHSSSRSPSPSTSSVSSGRNARRPSSPPRRSSVRTRRSSHSPSRPPRTRQDWAQQRRLPGNINNSVAFTVAGTSAAEPRLMVSNNDFSVTFYDIAVREGYAFRYPDAKGKGPATERWQSCGNLVLDAPVNHSSVSPDGRTLLCVGDTSKIYLHDLSASSNVTFSPITTLTLPSSSGGPYYIRNGGPNYSAAIPAAFSTAWSASGSKFAIGGQDGVVAVWDVRSSKPLRVLETERRTWGRGVDHVLGDAGWPRDDPWYNQYGSAPGWGVRSVKFGSGASGREVLAFTEHTSKLHIVDTSTFETEQIVRVPTPRQIPRRTSRTRSASPVRRNPGAAAASAFAAAASITPEENERLMRILEFTPSQIEDLTPEQQQIVQELRRIAVRVGLHQFDPAEIFADLDEATSRHTPHHELDDLDSDADTDVEHPRSAPERGTQTPPSLAPSPAASDPGGRASPWFTPPRTTPSGASTPGAPSLPRSKSAAGRDRREVVEEKYEYDPDVDLAGLCFDPTGTWIYAASTRGVTEWVVRGATKTWWGEAKWA